MVLPKKKRCRRDGSLQLKLGAGIEDAEVAAGYARMGIFGLALGLEMGDEVLDALGQVEAVAMNVEGGSS